MRRISALIRSYGLRSRSSKSRSWVTSSPPRATSANDHPAAATMRRPGRLCARTASSATKYGPTEGGTKYHYRSDDMAEMSTIEMQDRELFAAMAMQALITRGERWAADMIAKQAVAYADALIEALAEIEDRSPGS